MRTRRIESPSPSGTFVTKDLDGNIVETVPGFARLYEHAIDDWQVGYNSPGDLYIDKIDRSIINHTWIDGLGIYSYEGNYAFPVSPQHIPLGECIPGFPDSTDYLATKLAARTNPSTPDVSMPQFIGELRDLPEQVFKRGQKGIEFTKGNLDSVGIRFGILPMVSDVLKLMNFHDSVQRRTGDLVNLAAGRGTRKKVHFGKGMKVNPIGSDIQPASGPLSFTAVIATEWEVWGVARWKPVDGFNPPPPGNPELAKLARSLCLGVSSRNDIYSYMRDAWELIPWSWMADWYLNIGDYLDASRNSSSFHPEGLWIMRMAHTTIKAKGPLGTYKLTHVTKQREQGYVSLTADHGVITPDQLSTLTGLALRDRRHRLPKAFR